MGYFQTNIFFASHAEACKYAKDEAIRKGITFTVVACEGGWKVAGYAADKGANPINVYGRPLNAPYQTNGWNDYETPESEQEKQQRIREMNERATTANYEKTLRESYSPTRVPTEVCSACDRPLHACRCSH